MTVPNVCSRSTHITHPPVDRSQKAKKAIVITVIALLALSFLAVTGFVIAAAVTGNALFLLGAIVPGMVAASLVGTRNIFCDTIVKWRNQAKKANASL